MEPLRDAKMKFISTYVSLLLYETNGNVAAAARIAKVDRGDLYELIRRTGIDLKVIRAECSTEVASY